MKRFSVILSALLLSSAAMASQVSDPYAWLENMESAAAQHWIEQRNEDTDQYFNQISQKQAIRKILEKNSRIESFGLPVQKNCLTFFSYRGVEDDKARLCVKDRSKNIRTLVNLKEEDAILFGFKVSEDGRFITYALSDCGSDKTIWKFLNVETGEILPDEIQGILFSSPEWSSDGRGVYYIHLGTAIYYHELGETSDHLIEEFQEAHDGIMRDLHVVFHGKKLLFSFGTLNKQGLYILDPSEKSLTPLYPQGQSRINFVGELQNKLLFITNEGTAYSKMISIDAAGSIEELIPEEDSLLVDACVTKEYIVCGYLKDCVCELMLFDHHGRKISPLPVPGRGSITVPFRGWVLSGNQEDNRITFTYTDFTTPERVMQLDIDHRLGKPLFAPSYEMKGSYITEQVFVPSKDGTPIPVFLTYKKGMKFSGGTPTLLYGYGGFNLFISPWYTPLFATWLEVGGLLATVNLRGGSEYGEVWHQGGMKHNKQNVFDDFISAAEWLIAEGYTSPEKLAINGRSNGGLLVGACLVQRPDLFGAAIPQVGVHDMLKFHQFTIGWAWKCEFGDPDDPEDYEYLRSYSPYHNVKEASYPATLVTTADHDDRVVPLHSTKFAARLMEMQQGAAPILLRVYHNAAHKAGNSVFSEIEENVEILSFLYKELNLDDRDFSQSQNPKS